MNIKSIRLIALSFFLVLITNLLLVSKVSASTNLIKNPSVENGTTLPSSWYKGGYGNNNRLLVYPVTGYDGNKALQVTITSYTDGDAKWYFEDVSVTPSESYTYTEYFKSDVPSDIYIRYTNASGSFSYVYIDSLPASSTWSKYQKSITIPIGVTSLTVFHVIASVGTLTTDSYSLTLDDNTPPPVGKLTQGIVTLTFDDGWLSAYNNAVPKLRSAGLNATFYLVTDFLNNEPGYLNKSQAKKIKSYGFEIGSHSINHPDLSTLDTASQHSQIFDSKTILESLGLGPIQSFAYPYGIYDSNLLSMVSDAGYSSSRTAGASPLDVGYNYKGDSPYTLKTFSVEVDTTVAQVKKWIDNAVSQKAWTILVFHQVDNKGEQYSVTPSNLQKILTYLKNQKVKVVTMSEGVSLIK